MIKRSDKTRFVNTIGILCKKKNVDDGGGGYG